MGKAELAKFFQNTCYDTLSRERIYNQIRAAREKYPLLQPQFLKIYDSGRHGPFAIALVGYIPVNINNNMFGARVRILLPEKFPSTQPQVFLSAVDKESIPAKSVYVKPTGLLTLKDMYYNWLPAKSTLVRLVDALSIKFQTNFPLAPSELVPYSQVGQGEQNAGMAEATAEPKSEGKKLIYEELKHELEKDQKEMERCCERLREINMIEDACVIAYDTCEALEKSSEDLRNRIANIGRERYEVPEGISKYADARSAHEAFLQLFREDLMGWVANGELSIEEYIKILRTHARSHFKYVIYRDICE